MKKEKKIDVERSVAKGVEMYIPRSPIGKDDTPDTGKNIGRGRCLRTLKAKSLSELDGDRD